MSAPELSLKLKDEQTKNKILESHLQDFQQESIRLQRAQAEA